MKARDIMTCNVVSVSPDTSLAEAIKLMLEKKISGLPVLTRDGKLIGIVSEGDCLRREELATGRIRPRWLQIFIGQEKLAEEYIHSHGRKVYEVMSTDPISIGEETRLHEIVRLMETRHVKRLPVVRDGKVVGIVSRANLLHALASVTPEKAAAQKDDRAIREEILAALAKLPWAAKEFVNVVVNNGIVDLWGSYLGGRQDETVVVAAENVPGVKCVRNHMTWVDPISGLVVYSPDDEKDRNAELAASQT